SRVDAGVVEEGVRQGWLRIWATPANRYGGQDDSFRQRRACFARQTGRTRTCFFLPSDSLTTPSPVTSLAPTTRLSSETDLSLMRTAPPCTCRRASPFEAASPALTNSASTPMPASISAIGTSTVGRLSASA